MEGVNACGVPSVVTSFVSNDASILLCKPYFMVCNVAHYNSPSMSTSSMTENVIVGDFVDASKDLDYILDDLECPYEENLYEQDDGVAN